MQERRLADYNTRQDKQIAAADAARKEEMAQRLQMHNDTMALHRQQLGQALSAMNKPQLVEYEDEYGVKRKGWGVPGNPNVTPISFGGASGGTGGGIPGLDAAFNAAMNDVEQPGFGAVGGGMAAPTDGNQPLSPAIRRSIEILLPHLASDGGLETSAQAPESQRPALAASHAKDPLTRTFQLLGIEFPQGDQQQNTPAQPAPSPRNLTVAERGFDAMGLTFPNAQELAAGTIYTPSGEVYIPREGEQIPFQGKQEERVRHR